MSAVSVVQSIASLTSVLYRNALFPLRSISLTGKAHGFEHRRIGYVYGSNPSNATFFRKKTWQTLHANSSTGILYYTTFNILSLLRGSALSAQA